MKLIDADDVYRYIKTEINPYGKPFQGSAYELGLKIMEHIEKMSATYDVDKVAERLEEIREEILTDTAYDNDTVNHYLGYVDLMVEIVNEGGAND